MICQTESDCEIRYLSIYTHVRVIGRYDIFAMGYGETLVFISAVLQLNEASSATSN